ncbi:hypothetical protein MIND_01270800 [Mycena indigotica]|uniref:Endo-1,3(4)-beta-glucanase 1 carbohydrate binding domain-containing protein n=1 Tax=Mycena indigotica TaxID=2126181 RepID=A0A8H6S2Y2_9AGAR|nr:uncharacterized protein MIND_01270800 [Mycena indigotica]KAF7291270.1 hypothetical protein MIND_01270800 [Mycena indigotica]
MDFGSKKATIWIQVPNYTTGSDSNCALASGNIHCAIGRAKFGPKLIFASVPCPSTIHLSSTGHGAVWMPKTFYRAYKRPWIIFTSCNSKMHSLSLSAAFVTALATTSALAQTLLTCGASTYFYSTASCFDNAVLCPVVNGVRTISCNGLCYDPNKFTCDNTTLIGYNPNLSGQLFDCGAARYDPSAYVCYDGDFLCPKSETIAYLPCGDACYWPDSYTCSNGTLGPNPGPRDCIPNFSDNIFCNDQGCFELECCPGLIAVADKCRDPCDFGPIC